MPHTVRSFLNDKDINLGLLNFIIQKIIKETSDMHEACNI